MATPAMVGWMPASWRAYHTNTPTNTYTAVNGTPTVRSSTVTANPATAPASQPSDTPVE